MTAYLKTRKGGVTLGQLRTAELEQMEYQVLGYMYKRRDCLFMNEPCWTRQLSAAALTACFAPVVVYSRPVDVRWVALAGLAA